MSDYLLSQKRTQIRTAPSTSLRTGLALIAVVTAVSFLSSLDNGFVNWDDDELIIRNPLIRDLSWNKIKAAFSSFHFSNYHPLVLLSFSLEYALWGLHPLGYHLTNLLLHLGNTLLVFALVLRLNSHPLPAFVAALLFGVHPLHVESVAWVTERKDVLSTLFFLGALLCYLRYQEDRQGRFYALALVSFILSLLAKPMGVTLPLILFLCDYLCARAWTARSLVEKVPFVMMSVLFSLVAVLAQHSGGGINATRFSALGDNILIACWGLIFYLRKTLAPVGLSALYSYPPEISLGLPAFFLPPILLLVLAVGVWISQQYTRTVVFGSLFFFVTLLPVLKIIPIGEAAAADRYMYISSIGLFYLVGVAFQKMWTWEILWQGAKKGALTAFLSLTILTLVVLTWQRCNTWQDSETLWLSVLAHDPDNPIARHGLGQAYGQKGRLDEAIVEFKKALAVAPNYAPAHSNLGYAYEVQGRRENAIVEYHKALTLHPDHAPTHNNLGNLYRAQGRREDAIAEFLKAISTDPMYAKAHYNLGNIYGAQEQYDAAIAEYQKALSIDPTYARAHHNLALAHFHKGSYREAIKHYDQARALGYPGDPSLAEALVPYRQAQ